MIIDIEVDQLTIRGSATGREVWHGVYQHDYRFGARIVDHDDKSKKSNHAEYAPTAMDLSAVAPGLSGPK